MSATRQSTPDSLTPSTSDVYSGNGHGEIDLLTAKPRTRTFEDLLDLLPTAESLLVGKDAIKADRDKRAAAREVKAAADAEDGIFALTDTGLAERFATQHAGTVRYCYPWKKWLYYDGQRWNPDCEGAIEAATKLTVRSIYAEAEQEDDDDKRKAVVSFARQSESAAKRAAMIQLARSEPGIPVLPAVLDINPWLLNCINGTLDLRTGNLRPHNPGDMLTKLCPVPYYPEALCPIWLATLDRLLDRNEELITYLQRFTGYCLTGSVEEHILNIWYGKGRNGKSTVANTLMEMLGDDYSMKAGADLLLLKNNDNTHPTGLTDLCGKRFVACIETEENRRLAESLAKELTGGDPIRARRMKENFWQFLPTHKIVLACNHKPIIRGTDDGIWGRIKLVPFSVFIPPDERDKKLPVKLQAEFPGILAWAVRGCLDWQRHGLHDPTAIINASAEYQDTENLLRNFVHELCILDSAPTTEIKASDFVEAYREWSGDKSMTTRKMTTALAEMGIEKKRNNGVWYTGICLDAVRINNSSQ